MVVSSGDSIGDIEYTLRKEMYDLRASAEGGDPFNLPTFAGQGTCPQFDPDEHEANIAKELLVELIANTRLNLAMVQRIDRERDEILQGSKRDFLACYNDTGSMIYLGRMKSYDGFDDLTIECGRTAQKCALIWQHPRDALKAELVAGNATSLAPVELSRIPHSRFGSCARGPASGIELDVEMKDEDVQVEEYEPDAAYGTYDGITNWHEAEAVAPLAASEALLRQTRQHGTD